MEILHLTRIFLGIVFLVLIFCNWNSKSQNLRILLIVMALVLLAISMYLGDPLSIFLWGLNSILQFVLWLANSVQKNRAIRKIGRNSKGHSDVSCDHCGTGESGNCPNCGAPLKRH